MTKPWTVQCSYMSHVANTVTVEADTLEEALEKAIEAANEDPAGWKSTGHVSDSHVDAVCEGADADPWGDGTLPIPDRFTERGEPPVVTLTGPVPPGAVEVSGGRGPCPDRNRSRHGHQRGLRSAASARQQTAGHGFRRTGREAPCRGYRRQGQDSHRRLSPTPARRHRQSIHPEPVAAPPGAVAGHRQGEGGRGPGATRSSTPPHPATGDPP